MCDREVIGESLMLRLFRRDVVLTHYPYKKLKISDISQMFFYYSQGKPRVRVCDMFLRILNQKSPPYLTGGKQREKMSHKTMMHNESCKGYKMNTYHVSLCQSVEEIRRIVTLIVEVLVYIKPSKNYLHDEYVRKTNTRNHHTNHSR